MIFHCARGSTNRASTLRVGLIAWLLLSLVGVGFAQPSDDTMLVIGSENDDVADFSYTTGTRTTQYVVITNVYDTLVEFELGNMPSDEQFPSLAESWEVDETNTVWTFNLREDVQFHHGHGELTAQDVKYSLDRSRDPERSTQAAQLAKIEDVKVVDDYTVQIELSSPDLFLLDKLANRSIGAIFPDGLSEDDIKNRPIGAGPFQFEYIEHEQEVVLSRFDDYWRGPANVAGIQIRFIEENLTRIAAFRAGELDIIEVSAVPWPEVEALEQRGAIVDVGGQLAQSIFFFNTQIPPFDDVLVRRAVSYALNREDLASLFAPLSVPNPYPLLWAPEEAMPVGVETYEFDPEKARQLLAEAGYPDGFSFKTIVYPPAYYHDVLLVAQANLAAVGINMEIEIVDGSTYHSEIRSQPGAPMTVYHFSRFPAVPVTLLQFYHGDAIPGKPNAISNFTFSEDLTDLIDEALLATTNDCFNEITADIQRKILEDALVHVNFALQRVVARAPYVDLGYEFRSGLTNNYPNMWSITLNK